MIVSPALLVFIIACALFVYVLAGYPLLVAFLARRRPRPVHKAPGSRTVSVVLPVFNGAKWIRAKLESILALDYPRELMQILVVSDGSNDGTDDIVREFAPEGVELLRVPQRGKAAALNSALENASGEILFFTDVRQPLSRNCLASLVACFADPEVGGACGELIVLDGATQEESSVGLYWTIEKWIRRQLTLYDSLLVVTGCVYALRRDLTKPIPTGSLGDDIYMPWPALMSGHRIVFEEDAKAYDYPTSMAVEFNRKVRTLGGLYQFVARTWKTSITPANRLWFHFLSYKVARLLLPFALIAIAISSPFLPAMLAPAAVAAQVLVYGLAAVDPMVPDTWRILKRLTSPARAFVLLMLASLWAVSVFFRPSQELWKTTQVRMPRPPL